MLNHLKSKSNNFVALVFLLLKNYQLGLVLTDQLKDIFKEFTIEKTLKPFSEISHSTYRLFT
jgi:hypothetical protein